MTISRECDHKTVNLRSGNAIGLFFDRFEETRGGRLSWQQRRHAVRAVCMTCRTHLSLGPSRESGTAYVDVLAARIAATASCGNLGYQDEETQESWPSGVIHGWLIHEDATVGVERYDIDRALKTKLRRAGYLARQMYVHHTDGRGLSLEGQKTFMRLLEQYLQKAHHDE